MRTVVNKKYKLATKPLNELKLDASFREDFGDLDELRKSIEIKGVLQPITVREDGLILAGRRRFQAAKAAGLNEIPVLIHDSTGELDDLEVELFENIHRKNLEWHEQIAITARIHEMMLAKHGDEWRQADTAGLLGRARSAVSDAVEMKQAIELIPELKAVKTAQKARQRYKQLVEEAVVTESMHEAPTQGAMRWANDHYIIGDALEGLRKCDDGIAHFAEVDPPYGINQKAEGYNEIAAADYPKFIETVAQATFRVLADNSWCVWWFGPTWFAEVKRALLVAGFKLDDIPAIWTKPNTASPTLQPNTYLNRGYEPFFICRKGSPLLRKRGRSNIFDYPSIRGDRVHSAERPIELITDILETFVYPGATIVSPFLGSGNTLIAAYKLGLTGWGYDLTKQYKRSFLVRAANLLDEVESSRTGEDA